MDAKPVVLTFVQTAIDCAIASADAYKARIAALAELAIATAEAKLALKKDPSGLPVIPVAELASANATAYAALAKLSSAQALAPFL